LIVRKGTSSDALHLQSGPGKERNPTKSHKSFPTTVACFPHSKNWARTDVTRLCFTFNAHFQRLSSHSKPSKN
jgi:hypothetical protein